MLHTVRIEPLPPTWSGLIKQHEADSVLGQSLHEWRRITRRELLGDSFGRVVATGHQAGFWHAGILAKYLAMDAAADELGADAVVELLVDQDVHDLRSIRVPAIDPEGVLVARELPWTHWPDSEEPKATGVLPPILAEPGAWELNKGDQFASLAVFLSCRAMGRSLVLHRNAPSRAEQFAHAAAILREVRFANRQLATRGLNVDDEWRDRRYLVAASSLSSTTLWNAVISQLRRDPRSAWEAYNRAVARRPEAGVVPLEHRTTGGCEVPCWLITPDGQRHRAFEHDLNRSDARLMPRALLMTGLVRMALVDLFIHGLGGAEYDRITEQWFGEWLNCHLAPDTMVTATATLDFERQAAGADDLARAQWLVHHLPFNIDRFLDDRGPRHERERLLREIESLPHGSAQRRRLFEQMRASQLALAKRHSSLLDAARENLRITQRRVEETALIHDRAWAFPLHAHEEILELRDEVHRLFVAR